MNSFLRAGNILEPGATAAPRITMVSKIRADGQPCPKCAEVKQKLDLLGLLQRIDSVLIADERDPLSSGMLLAAQHGVTVAPFFLVEDGDGVQVYTVFMRFLREVLQARSGSDRLNDTQEIQRAHPELDYV